ncbi:DUF721 domain-containing protein [Streptomyces sp. NBC_00654]|uniref:DUF721 domain-containing protein n=1 Tax=Streptomyces sp. NBC_00654 TaxID=2975799 RepID=UPI00224E986D|nr:DUF721 domain-containing protein [Streptomyces sp. NBC_00654]MCX4971034.1 DUF721 domain-containing protein [Streptomyces sp. NBC_00654]
MTMTSTSNPVDPPVAAGVDLARVALRAAQAQARQQPTTKKPVHRRASSPRGDGRDPLGLGALLGRLVVERAWDVPVAGGRLSDRWATIAPHLAGHVQPAGFDTDTGELLLHADSDAWATKARLDTADIVAAANRAAGRTAVRSVKTLCRPYPAAPSTTRPATTPISAPDSTPPRAVPAAAPEPAVKSAGFLEVLAAHRQAWPGPQTDPTVQAKKERQVRERLREPEELFADGRQALSDLKACTGATTDSSRSSDAARTRALQRLAAERAGLSTITPAAAPRLQHVVQVITDAEAS